MHPIPLATRNRIINARWVSCRCVEINLNPSQIGQSMKRYLGWITAGLVAAAPFAVRASDHAEAPLVEADQAADIADIYAFLDPNNNANVVLALDVHGFIVPGENGNLSGFDPDVLFRFNIENTGDAAPDK